MLKWNAITKNQKHSFYIFELNWECVAIFRMWEMNKAQNQQRELHFTLNMIQLRTFRSRNRHNDWLWVKLIFDRWKKENNVCHLKWNGFSYSVPRLESVQSSKVVNSSDFFVQLLYFFYMQSTSTTNSNKFME